MKLCGTTETASGHGTQPSFLHLDCETCNHRFKALTGSKTLLVVGIEVPECFRFGRCGDADKDIQGFCTDYVRTH